jgi:3',5'-cyclic-AMP phosphodiesterase
MLPDIALKTHATGPDLQLVQITDTHLFGDPAARLRGVASLPALRATLELARTDIAQAEAILLTGDLVQDDATGYANVREAFAPLGRPVLTIAGNHDLKGPLRAALSAPPFHIDGHHDHGAWRIVMLDSSVEGRAAGELAPAELGRLEAALAGAGGRHVLVCLHHHPVSLDSRWLDQVALQNSRAFFSVIDRHPCVRGIVFGHVHQAHDSLRGDVRILGTPSTCAQFLPGSDRFQVDPRPPAYRQLVLRANGAIGTRLNWLAGYASGLTATSQNSLRA